MKENTDKPTAAGQEPVCCRLCHRPAGDVKLEWLVNQGLGGFTCPNDQEPVMKTGIYMTLSDGLYLCQSCVHNALAQALMEMASRLPQSQLMFGYLDAETEVEELLPGLYRRRAS